MARPKIDIDGNLVEKMASWGCKTVEIADYFNCDTDTITNRFSVELRKGRTALKTNLRQWQLAAARGGNSALLIWLGKQLLDQKEISRIELIDVPEEVFEQEAIRRLKLVTGTS